jgi:hypothetical protein
MKRINKWNGHTNEMADNGLVEIMGRTGNRAQRTEDETVVSTSGCKHRYSFILHPGQDGLLSEKEMTHIEHAVPSTFS